METFCLQHGRETKSIFIVGLHLYKNLYQFIVFLRFTKTDIDVSPIRTTFFVVSEIHSFMAIRTRAAGDDRALSFLVLYHRAFLRYG